MSDEIDSVEGLTISAQEIEAQDAKVRTLNTDILAFNGPPMFETPTSVTMSPSFVTWKKFRNVDWMAHTLKWARWNQDHQTILSQSGGAVAGEFAALLGEYNELRRRFLEFSGAKTSASAAGMGGGPVDTLVDGAIKIVVVVGGVWILWKIFAEE